MVPRRVLPSRRAAFTLAEVAVTLVIVGAGLIWVLQGINSAKLQAKFTHDHRVARELGLETLAQVESGLFWDEIFEGDERLTGNYAEQGYEDFYWELILGDEGEFTTLSSSDLSESGRFDSWKPSEDEQDAEDEDEEAEEPYEVVRLRVSFPTVGLQDVENFLTLERWIPWDQVYGEEDEEGEGIQ